MDRILIVDRPGRLARVRVETIQEAARALVEANLADLDRSGERETLRAFKAEVEHLTGREGLQLLEEFVVSEFAYDPPETSFWLWIMLFHRHLRGEADPLPLPPTTSSRVTAILSSLIDEMDWEDAFDLDGLELLSDWDARVQTMGDVSPMSWLRSTHSLLAYRACVRALKSELSEPAIALIQRWARTEGGAHGRDEHPVDPLGL